MNGIDEHILVCLILHNTPWCDKDSLFLMGWNYIFTWMYEDMNNVKYLLHLLHIHAHIWYACNYFTKDTTLTNLPNNVIY